MFYSYKWSLQIQHRNSCSVPAKGDSTNGNGMCGISFKFLTTDN